VQMIGHATEPLDIDCDDQGEEHKALLQTGLAVFVGALVERIPTAQY
jgi:hypothetical protein